MLENMFGVTFFLIALFAALLLLLAWPPTIFLD
jgi:hypothetical protein